MVFVTTTQEAPRHGHPSPCRPRTPTCVARRSGRLPPLRGLRLAAQRHLPPPSGRVGTAAYAALAVQGLPGQRLAPAVRRDLPPATADLPGADGRPVRALCQFAGPVPAPGPAGLRGGGFHPVAGRAGGGARPGARPAGCSAVVGRGGRDLAVPRGRQASRGRGPGAGGRTAGPAPERARLRLGRLVHGPGRTRGAGADDRRRPGLRPGPRDGGPGPAAVRRAHAAHRGAAHPGPRRGRRGPPGPGPAAHPASDRRRRGPSCWPSGRR